MGTIPVPAATATNFVPSADDAIDTQLVMGALDGAQVTPESDER